MVGGQDACDAAAELHAAGELLDARRFVDGDGEGRIVGRGEGGDEGANGERGGVGLIAHGQDGVVN